MRFLIFSVVMVLGAVGTAKIGVRPQVELPPCSGTACGGFSMSDAELSQDLVLLEKLVNMPSETNHISGVAAANLAIEEEFTKLGFTSNYYANPIIDPVTQKPISADLLIAELKGQNSQFITFIVHSDTVFKATADGKVPTPFKIVDSVTMPVQIPIPGKRILGSGIGDNKGGVVMLLRTLKMLLSQGGKPKYGFRALISSNEETGAPGHKDSFMRYALDSVAVLGLEPSGKGNILKARGGVHWYEVNVSGVEAHAGVNHERGVNACLDLSIKIAKISELTDYANNVTVNAGTIQGGKRANIVCGDAKAVIDTRFPDQESNQMLARKMDEIFLKPEVGSHDGTNQVSKTTIKTLTDGPTFTTNAMSAPFIANTIERIRQMDNFAAQAVYSRGGADISNMALPNIILMDGLGPVTDGSHTEFEYIILETMRTRALILADLVQSIK